MISKCDICGKTDTWCESLVNDYHTKDIHDVCETCLSEANKQLRKFQDMTTQLNKTWMRRFLDNMKTKFNGEIK